MKDKLAELKKSYKALLDEAAKLIGENKVDEAKAKQAEAAKLKGPLEVMKAQVEAQAELELEELKTKAAEAEAKAKQPVRPPFETEDPNAKAGEGAKSFVQLKYGEIEPAVKAVIGDIYGPEYAYNELRHEQMEAFTKYIRFGVERLNAKETSLITTNWKNIILQPKLIADEIKSGRSVAEIKATLVEGSNDLGGWLVPEDYRAKIIQRLIGNTVVRQRAMVVTTTRDAIEWPRLEGGNTVYTSAVRVTWVQETPASATAASTNPTVGLIRIPIHTVMARTDLSRNLLEDSAFNLLDVTAKLFAEAMAVDEDAQFLTGMGAGTPQGVLGGRGNGNQAAPITGVTSVVSGNATAITSDGLVQMVYAIASQYRNSAVHVMARTTQRDIRLLKDGESRYMWQPSLTAGQPATLLGYPVAESESMDAIGANAHVIIFGDWGNGYIIADRVGMSIERVTDTTTTGQNYVALFARRRLGGQPVAPWAFAAQKIST